AALGDVEEDLELLLLVVDRVRLDGDDDVRGAGGRLVGGLGDGEQGLDVAVKRHDGASEGEGEDDSERNSGLDLDLAGPAEGDAAGRLLVACVRGAERSGAVEDADTGGGELARVG